MSGSLNNRLTYPLAEDLDINGYRESSSSGERVSPWRDRNNVAVFGDTQRTPQ